MEMASQLRTPISSLRGKNLHCPLETSRYRYCGNKKNLCPSGNQPPFPGRPVRPDLCPLPSRHHYNKFLLTIRPHLLRLFNIAQVNNACYDRMVCLFSWRYIPLWLYFHSPVAGFSLLIHEVS
jgi:hypothetical protein